MWLTTKSMRQVLTTLWGFKRGFLVICCHCFVLSVAWTSHDSLRRSMRLLPLVSVGGRKDQIVRRPVNRAGTGAQELWFTLEVATTIGDLSPLEADSLSHDSSSEVQPQWGSTRLHVSGRTIRRGKNGEIHFCISQSLQVVCFDFWFLERVKKNKVKFSIFTVCQLKSLSE